MSGDIWTVLHIAWGACALGVMLVGFWRYGDETGDDPPM